MPSNLPGYELHDPAELARLGIGEADIAKAMADLNALARSQFTTPERFPFTNEPLKLIDGRVYVHAGFIAVMRKVAR